MTDVVEKSRGGRPSTFNPDVADTICQELMAGRSLKAVCQGEGMPGTSTVYEWLSRDAEFADSYARAREVQADVLADEIVHIADTEPDAQKARNRIDARKWLASKLRPKKYADRVELDHRVEGNTGMQVTVNVIPARVDPLAIDVIPAPTALPVGSDYGA